jgi:hypothetical protein
MQSVWLEDEFVDRVWILPFDFFELGEVSFFKNHIHAALSRFFDPNAARCRRPT